MKLKVIIPAVTDCATRVAPMGLGSLMSVLDATDELVVTAEQAQQPSMWEESDVVVINVDANPRSSLNLAELYRMTGAHVVLIGSKVSVLADYQVRNRTIFVGPPDELWAAFLEDFRRGEASACYTADFSLCDAGLFVSSVHVA
jgi:hypothetical protein